MGANQSAPAEVGEPKAVGHDMDSDQWTEEFSKEYNRLRSTDAELSTPAEPSDALDDAEQECERERPGPPRVPLQEMMVKESLSEIQSMLGPVIGREIISEGAGAENRFSYTFDAAGDDRGHRGGDEYETSHGMRKRPRLGSPQHHGMVGASGDLGFSGGHEGGAGYEGRGRSSGAPEWRGHGERGHGRSDGGAADDAELSYYGADPVQRQNVNELNATMEAALSALYDNTGMGGGSLLGTPQFTARPLPPPSRLRPASVPPPSRLPPASLPPGAASTRHPLHSRAQPSTAELSPQPRPRSLAPDPGHCRGARIPIAWRESRPSRRSS